MKKFEFPEIEVEKLIFFDVITTSDDDDWEDWVGGDGENNTGWS